MSTEKIKETINQYFDNELTKSEEVLLFTQLSENDEARNYFKDMNLLKTSIDEISVDYPEKLDDKILSNLKTQSIRRPEIKNRRSMLNYISYAVAIILVAISFFFYNESMQYRNKLEFASQQVYQQNQMINALFNSLPQAEVRGTVENAIVVTPKM